MMKSAAGIILLLLLTFLLAGCGSDNNVVMPPDLSGKPVATPNYAPVTTIGQFIPTTDGAVAPGMANYWDIDKDFSMDDGSDDQFDTFLGLSVGATAFPADQVQSELTFYTPAMGAAEGARTTAVSDDTTSWYNPIDGVYSAYLYPTGHSILKQKVNLTTATGPVTLNCSFAGSSYSGIIADGPETFRVVIRDRAGTELAVLYSVQNNKPDAAITRDLTPYIGSTIVLSFEFSGQFEPIVIDNVSVTDGSAAEFITNGDFESGTLAPWVANTASNMLQNIKSGTRSVEGLDVTRSFYTVPDKLWGRWVDVFANPTGSAITKTVSYYNDLGSDEFGIVYFTPGTNDRAVTSWDSGGDRDIAFVYGDATSVTFTSDDGLYNGNGTGLIPTTYDITVPAGGKVAIVNFIVMGGTDTGLTALDITATADEVDAVAKAIVKNFWTDPQYRTGMTQSQIEAISNF